MYIETATESKSIYLRFYTIFSTESNNKIIKLFKNQSLLIVFVSLFGWYGFDFLSSEIKYWCSVCTSDNSCVYFVHFFLIKSKQDRNFSYA